MQAIRFPTICILVRDVGGSLDEAESSEDDEEDMEEQETITTEDAKEQEDKASLFFSVVKLKVVRLRKPCRDVFACCEMSIDFLLPNNYSLNQ